MALLCIDWLFILILFREHININSQLSLLFFYFFCKSKELRELKTKVKLDYEVVRLWCNFTLKPYDLKTWHLKKHLVSWLVYIFTSHFVQAAVYIAVSILLHITRYKTGTSLLYARKWRCARLRLSFQRYILVEAHLLSFNLSIYHAFSRA